MEWSPKKLDAEYEMLIKEAFARMSDDDTYRSEDFSAVFKSLIEEKGSEELKAFEQYSSRTGDEGELREKDGSFIFDEEGWPHQDWKNSKDGYLRDSKENRIFYKDGTPVPNIEMPELVRKMYEEEIGCRLDFTVALCDNSIRKRNNQPGWRAHEGVAHAPRGTNATRIAHGNGGFYNGKDTDRIFFKSG